MADDGPKCRSCGYPLGDSEVCTECGRPRATRTRRWPDLTLVDAAKLRGLRASLFTAALAALAPLLSLAIIGVAQEVLGLPSAEPSWLPLLHLTILAAYPCAYGAAWMFLRRLDPRALAPGPLGPRWAVVGLAVTGSLVFLWTLGGYIGWRQFIPAHWAPAVALFLLLMLGLHALWAVRLAESLADHLPPDDRLGDAAMRGGVRALGGIAMFFAALPLLLELENLNEHVPGGYPQQDVLVLLAILLIGLLFLLVAVERRWTTKETSSS